MDQTSQYTPPTVPGVDQPATYYYYNKDKQLTRVTRPDGKEALLDYNQDSGKLETLVIPRGNYTYTYQADGDKKLESITAPDGGQISYIYDGPLTTGVTWSGTISGEVTQTFNNDFQLESQTVNGDNTVNFGYDQDGLLTQVGDLILTRDQNNGMLIGTTINTLTTEYTYNDFGEMIGYQANNGSEELFSSTYTRDKLGRIETKTETILGTTTSRTYVYDQAGRLEQVKEGETVLEEYSYDTNGNRTSVTKNGQTISATYDAQDRMLTYGDATYTYTDNGELAIKTDSEGTTIYNYDIIGNLTYVQLPDGTEIEYIIDGQNRRIGKKVNGILVQGFTYQDQLNIVAELDGEGNVVAQFAYGEKGHIPAYMIKDGTTYRIISDHLGSPRLVVDIDTRYVAQRRDYDPWGNIVLDTNPGFVPFGFAGGIDDDLTMIIRFGYRDYSGDIGRWTTKDPILLYGGLNLFIYTFNAPTNLIDPYGLWTRQIGASFTAGGGLGGTVGAGVAFGVNEENGEFQLGFYHVCGLGVFLGVDAGFMIDYSWSSNQDIEKLNGPALTIGGSVGVPIIGPTAGAEGNLPFDPTSKPSVTFSTGWKAGPLGSEAHGFITNTTVLRVK